MVLVSVTIGAAAGCASPPAESSARVVEGAVVAPSETAEPVVVPSAGRTFDALPKRIAVQAVDAENEIYILSLDEACDVRVGDAFPVTHPDGAVVIVTVTKRFRR